MSDIQYVYLWADGIHVNVRLEDEGNQRQCILVLMGTTADGKKELLAVCDGFRESEQSWYELLINLKQRGLTLGAKLTIGDGALGFWAALRKVFGETVEQRCWFHKTGNVLNCPSPALSDTNGDAIMEFEGVSKDERNETRWLVRGFNLFGADGDGGVID